MSGVRFTPALLVFLGVVLTPDGKMQDRGAELLLPGTEYHRTDLPADPTGAWWVLHGSANAMMFEPLEIHITESRTCGDDAEDQRNGRAISVPGARNPILLVRGYPGLTAGPVRSSFLDDGTAGEAQRIEIRWDDRPAIVLHVTHGPEGDQVGTYRIKLTVGDREFSLYTDQWHGDGHWRLRWMGDLNRDGWPDLLVDASYKYSVYTSRLFLSRVSAGQVEFREVATLMHTAC